MKYRILLGWQFVSIARGQKVMLDRPQELATGRSRLLQGFLSCD